LLCAWLVRYGVGKRIKQPYTRKIIDAMHSGELLTTNYKKTEVFGLEIPTEIDGVPSEILDPINTVRSIIACKSLLKILKITR
jgi:phosphoenolpyruvate carboxykinase (ATP)